MKTTRRSFVIAASGLAFAPGIKPFHAQGGWRWCPACACLYFRTNGLGRCAATDKNKGSHTDGGGEYVIHWNDRSKGQPGWKYCDKCLGLFHESVPNGGKCPAGGSHHNGGSDYALLLDNSHREAVPPGHQGHWRYCSNCGMLHHADREGKCPNGGDHLHNSGDYRLEMVQVAKKFPIRVRGDKSFKDGGGADWVIEITISNNGKIDMLSNIKAHRSLNGWCGRFAVYLFDRDGNNLGRYGMGEDHSWCVNGRLNPAGQHERNDEIHQDIPRDVLPNIHSVGVHQVSAPSGKFSLEEAKKIARKIAGVE